MRLFTAINLPDEVRERLAQVTDQLRPLANLQWSGADKFHITTKFLGEFADQRLEELMTVLTAIRSPGPIQISIEGIDWFAGGRVLYAGVTASPELAELARTTDTAAATLGVPVEDRAFRPHLTLARNRSRASAVALEAAIAGLPSRDFGSFQTASFALYLSRGGKYTTLKEFSFT